MAHGDIVHIDLPSDDIARAKSFYEGVFGWQISGMEEFPDFELFRTGQENVGGGIGLRGTTAPDKPRVYIEVDSLDDALAKVQELGGSIVVDKTEVPGMGWYAAVADTEGSEIGLWQNPPG